MNTAEGSPDQLPPAVEIFARFLALHEEGEEPDFEAFCAEHAQFEPKLRRLHARWRELTSAIEEDADPSVSDRVEQRFGVGCDPAISLDGPDSDRTGGEDAARVESGELVARGGMGEIRRIWDPDLRRTLAMKVLLSTDTDRSDGDRAASARSDPRSLSRFLAEAQITAQLEHPGIVPVHELGLDASGRVYFTMALIRGRSLKDVFRLVHEEQEGWNRTRALGVLLRVCEAVAFAHSKRVVHRDLKPANVMVGRFGETYVMDWGLAHVLNREDRLDLRLRTEPQTSLSLSSIRSSRRDAADEEPDSPLVTMDGDVVGTPAYMAPEQARGEVDRIGPQADVYSIGAMLYQLLAGRMPYLPGDARITSRTLLARVIDGPPRSIRALSPEVPAELCAICEKAMARDPADRYPDVLELAEDLRAFLESRVVRAHATGTWAELRKWVSRNRGLSVASVAAVLALALGLVFSMVENARADRQAARAEANSDLAFDAVDRMLTRVGDRELANVPQMDAVRKELLRDALELNLQVLASRQGDAAIHAEVAKAHQRVAAIHWKLGELAQAEQAQRACIAAFEAVVRDNPGQPKLRAELVWASNALATYALSRGRHADGQALLEAVLDGLDDIIRSFPNDPVYRDRRAAVLSNLAVAHYRQGRTEDALRSAEQALAIREDLMREHASDPVYRHGAASQCVNVGFMYEQLARYAEAAATYRTGIDAIRGLLAEDVDRRKYRETYGKLLNNLGIVQMRDRGTSGAAAVDTLRDAVANNRDLLRDFPGVPSYHGGLGGSLSNLGQAMRGQGDLAGARVCLEEAVEQTRIAHAAAPEDPQHRSYLASQYPKLCTALIGLRLHREAATRAEEYTTLGFLESGVVLGRASAYIAVCARLAAEDPDLSPAARAELIERYASRAVAMVDEAIEAGWLDVAALEHRNYDAVRDREDFARSTERVRSRAAERKRD